VFSYCQACEKSKSLNKSERCHSCARKKQHRDGVFKNNSFDLSIRYKFCNFCNGTHEIIKGESNDFWLFRRSKSRERYECRKHRKHLYNQRRLDPSTKLRKTVSNLIRDCIAKRGAYKDASFPKYVDWSVKELKQHLESKFKDGMSWENYGQWHIDHVIPDSWFKYDSPYSDGFKKSWALENLQPLWAKENLKKGSKQPIKA